MRRFRMMLLVVLFLAALVAPLTAGDYGVFDGPGVAFFYIEVYAAPDPSMGGGQPLVESFDSSEAPTNYQMQQAYAMAYPGGHFLVLAVDEDGDAEFHSAGDF